MVKTSDTHPIRVDFVRHEKVGLPGRLGLTFAPGKTQPFGQAGNWARDLDKDLSRLRHEYGADILVSLLEEHEFSRLGIPDLRKRAAEHGIRSVWFPVRDQSVPTSAAEFHRLVKEVCSELSRGSTVVIHCMGGLGRTGLLAAASLVAVTDMSPNEAIAEVRESRPGAVETREQEMYVAEFARLIRDGGNSRS